MMTRSILALLTLALAGCGAESPTGPEPIVALPSAPAAVSPIPADAPVRTFDAELVGRLGAVRIWTNLPISGRVVVQWRIYEDPLSEWCKMEETAVDLGPMGDVTVLPRRPATGCSRYTVEMIGQGWRESRWSSCFR
jgi:hypothetical protein